MGISRSGCYVSAFEVEWPKDLNEREGRSEVLKEGRKEGKLPDVVGSRKKSLFPGS